jgi:cytosine/adenosine deaminase-related metal-dependent hydrolase
MIRDRLRRLAHSSLPNRDPAQVRVFTAPWVLPGDGAPTRDGAVVVELGGPVLDIGPKDDVLPRWRGAFRVDLGGVLLPGLVDAYARNELGDIVERPEAGLGLDRLVRFLVEVRLRTEALDPASREARIRALVRRSVEAGTAATGEVTQTLRSVPAMAREGLHGVAFHDVPGLRTSARKAAKVLGMAAMQKAGIVPWPDGIRYRLAPRQVVGGVGTLVLEIVARAAEGLHDERSIREALGGARARYVLVQGAEGNDLLRAGRGTPMVVCPRSTRLAVGRPPPVVAILESGTPLALGTDSSATAPERSVLREAAELLAGAPEIPALSLLRAATVGGAEALGIPNLGRLQVGVSPGLLHAATPGGTPDDPAGWLLRQVPDLHWLCRAAPPSASS